ncbi:hypothetical protein [Streptomyces sp. NPDC088755]|uniref:hypothetical protein n=1 Tax=Streptomyces sp. NPDC088755 TaxID=3365888 RepID=UPI0037F1AFFC
MSDVTIGWPGHRITEGDSVRLELVPGGSEVMEGEVTVQGLNTPEGNGYLELRLPDANPQHRRLLEQCKHLEVRLFRSGVCLYTSPWLRVTDVAWEKDGLVVHGVPGERPA